MDAGAGWPAIFGRLVIGHPRHSHTVSCRAIEITGQHEAITLGYRAQAIYGPQSGLRTVFDTNLTENGLDMDLDGGFGNIEVACDVLIRGALGELPQNKLLPVG